MTLQDADCLTKVNKPWSWIHSDIMDDNVHMEPSNLIGDGSINGYAVHKKGSWSPSHILDFSDLSIGMCFFFISCNIVCLLNSIRNFKETLEKLF